MAASSSWVTSVERTGIIERGPGKLEISGCGQSLDLAVNSGPLRSIEVVAVSQAWRLTQHNTVSPGQTVRMWYWWTTQDPSGRTVGDWKGPQQAVATPEQLLTRSPHVNTTANGFVVGDSDIIYSVDITGDDNSSGEFGEYEVWVQGMLP